MSKEEVVREPKQDSKEPKAKEPTVAAPIVAAPPALRGPRGVPGKRQGRVSMRLKRAWFASGQRTPLKVFAWKHEPDLAASWKANKAGKNQGKNAR